jgi:proline dehydrogenase
MQLLADLSFHAAADALVRNSRRFLGDSITFGVMRHTFMKQFCAGEDEDDIMPTINMLRANGIRAIIDYAAEDDSPAAPAAPQAQPRTSQQQQQQQAPSTAAAATEGTGSSSGSVSLDAAAGAGTWEPAPNLVAVGRQYSYENEATCDKHVEVFLKAIDTVAKLPDQGFAAIKVTALGNPQLLERMSAALVEIRSLFREADTDGKGSKLACSSSSQPRGW